jgi:hypothetical protein
VTCAHTTGQCFRYDASAHQFIFNLGTKGRAAPSPYTLIVTIGGASFVGTNQSAQQTHSLTIGLR